MKWWHDGELKPVGIEYLTLGSPADIESTIKQLVATVRAKRVEVSDHEGILLAHYAGGRIMLS